MKQTLSTTEAAAQLHRDENGAWSPAGAKALVKYLEELEGELGTVVEFDPAAIRCEYSEYPSFMDWAQDCFGEDWKGDIHPDLSAEETMHDDDGVEFDNDDEWDSAIKNYLDDHTNYIEFKGGIIVAEF